MEKTNLSYACLARVIREGGFKVRVSYRPGAPDSMRRIGCACSTVFRHTRSLYNRNFLDMWNGYLGVLNWRFSLITETTRHCLLGRCASLLLERVLRR